MSIVTDARDALIAALRGVEGVLVYGSPGVSVDPPAASVGLPELTWSGPDDQPSTATFVIPLVVAANEDAVDRLLALYPLVVEALDRLPAVAVKSAAPGTFPAGSADLPAYLIEIEVGL